MKLTPRTRNTVGLLTASVLLSFPQFAPGQRTPIKQQSNPVDSLLQLNDFRRIDGQENNASNTEWGSSDVPFYRLLPSVYTNGVDEPSGTTRPSAREVSNAIFAQDEDHPNSVGASDFLWQWGQFLDHDITETPLIDPAESFNITVPTGDEWFDPYGSGTQIITMTRSSYDIVDGVREQVNLNTSYIDASNVYGSDEDLANSLRLFDGSGKLKTSEGGLLPFAEDGSGFFVAGDIRSNEQIGLTAMHTLFVREHNYWCDQIAAGQTAAEVTHPSPRSNNRRRPRPDAESDSTPLTDEQIYQEARAMVAAELQAITYNEFLPLLLGSDAIERYRGYDSNVDATIANSFSTAAYRVGHTMLSSELLRLDAEGNPVEQGNIQLADAFFAPDEVIATGIEPIIRGLATQTCQNIDSYVIDDVRNFLFGPPGSGGFDLVSLNIQRGRDHGLPSLNEARVALGLDAYGSFDDVSSDSETVEKLSSVYTSVDDVDLWAGGLCEDKVPGALLGETFFMIITEQFTVLRDGDRFWYESYLPQDVVATVKNTKLSDIIYRNTSIGEELQSDVFRASSFEEQRPSRPSRPSRPNKNRGG